MKKLQYRGQHLHSLPVDFHKHAAILVYILIVVMIELVMQSCQSRILQTNEPGSAGKPSTDSTITKPGSPTGPDGQVGVFNTIKITRADTDYQTIQFDAAGKPMQYTNQYLFNQGTGAVRRTTYQFIYGSDGRLSRVTTSAGTYVVYKYDDNLASPVRSTEEYAANGKLLIFRNYNYSTSNRLIEINQQRTDGSAPTGRTYQYDVRGNLSQVTDFVMNSKAEHVIETITSYEDYDNGKQVENLLMEFPFLPDVTFHRNNFHAKVVRYKDGREISRETNTYAYNDQGLPTQKVSRSGANTLTATYTY
jgi:hypothetical protein